MPLSRDTIAAWTTSLAALFSVASCGRGSMPTSNELAEEFYESDSEIETAARECIAGDFAFIAEANGFADADLEELVATQRLVKLPLPLCTLVDEHAPAFAGLSHDLR